MIWGGIAALGAAALIVANHVAGQPTSPNTLLADPFRAAFTMFFWGWALGWVWNRLGPR